MARHINFQAAIAYNQRTGLCPICRRRPSKRRKSGSVGVTCGHPLCIRIWLPGHYLYEKEAPIPQTEETE